MSQAKTLAQQMADNIAAHAARVRQFASETADLCDSLKSAQDRVGVRFNFPELLEAIRDDAAAHRDMIVVLARFEKVLLEEPA